jgi:VanZ family protein
MRTSVVLATLAVLLVALSVSAAPAAQQNQDVNSFVDQLKHFWSAFEIWLYK